MPVEVPDNIELTQTKDTNKTGPKFDDILTKAKEDGKITAEEFHQLNVQFNNEKQGILNQKSEVTKLTTETQKNLSDLLQRMLVDMLNNGFTIKTPADLQLLKDHGFKLPPEYKEDYLVGKVISIKNGAQNELTIDFRNWRGNDDRVETTKEESVGGPTSGQTEQVDKYSLNGKKIETTTEKVAPKVEQEQTPEAQNTSLKDQIDKTNKPSPEIKDILESIETGKIDGELVKKLTNLSALNKADLVNISKMFNDANLTGISKKIEVSSLDKGAKDSLIKFIKEQVPALEKSAFDNMLKNGIVIENQKDLDFITKNGSENIKKIIKDKFETDPKPKLDSNNSYVMKEGKIIQTKNDGKPTDELGKMDISKLNTSNIAEFSQEVKEGKVGGKPFDFSNFSRAIESLPKDNIFRQILEFFATLFGIKPNNGPKEGAEMSKEDKIKKIGEMTNEMASGYKLDDVINKDTIKDPKSDTTQKYIKDVQELFGVKDEAVDASDKKLQYGDKTKSAVTKIQKELKKTNATIRTDGICDKTTLEAYKKFLEGSTSEVKPVNGDEHTDDGSHGGAEKGPASEPTKAETSYIIKPKNTLIGIAKEKYGLKTQNEINDFVKKVIESNNNIDPKRLQIGKAIKIPAGYTKLG